MGPNEGVVALAGIIGVFGVPLAAMYIWIHRPSKTAIAPPSRMDAQLEARLDRIENAIQAIALETERIAEGQRFTTKLLSKQAEPVAVRAIQSGE